MADEEVVQAYQETKECPCVVCGATVTVTKFATPSKVKCPECKAHKTKVVDENGFVSEPTQMPQWGDIRDRELRNLTCLSCGTDMVLTQVVKSERWGDIVRCQCPKCLLTISISEQSRKNKWKHKPIPINFMPISKCGEHIENIDVGDNVGDVKPDEFGCIHEDGEGWNPNGVYCGECTITGATCKGLEAKYQEDEGSDSYRGEE